MRRELTTNQQCEHETRAFVDGALVKTSCPARHNDRSNGAPQQLVPCKDGRTVRFLCLKHAPQYQRGSSTYRRVRKSPPAEQERLL